MEDVLQVYERPYDPLRPVVCMDEKSKALHSEKNGREPMGVRRGQVHRQDYEYKREGTANIFMASEPLAGKRRVRITERRTGADFAEQLRILVDEWYAQAEMVVLVTDNLNTHGPWVLYEHFSPTEALRITSRIEWHYTPEHGSWLNMAEIELSVLTTQCLSERHRRISDMEFLADQVATWEYARNSIGASINWHFKTADARIKLRKLYPVLNI